MLAGHFNLFGVALSLVILNGVLMSANGYFVKRPENVTVYLGSVASFTCQIDLGDYDGIFWYATEENTPYSRLPLEYGAVTRTYNLPNNILFSTLTINALETTNNTRVLCKGNRFVGQDIFSTAYMRVVELDSNADIVEYTLVAVALLVVVACMAVFFCLWRKKNTRGKGKESAELLLQHNNITWEKVYIEQSTKVPAQRDVLEYV